MLPFLASLQQFADKPFIKRGHRLSQDAGFPRGNPSGNPSRTGQPEPQQGQGGASFSSSKLRREFRRSCFELQSFNLSLFFLLQGQSNRLSRTYRDVRDVLSPINLRSGTVQAGDWNDGVRN
jgi:hypothetical protein